MMGSFRRPSLPEGWSKHQRGRNSEKRTEGRSHGVPYGVARSAYSLGGEKREGKHDETQKYREGTAPEEGGRHSGRSSPRLFYLTDYVERRREKGGKRWTCETLEDERGATFLLRSQKEEARGVLHSSTIPVEG